MYCMAFCEEAFLFGLFYSFGRSLQCQTGFAFSDYLLQKRKKNRGDVRERQVIAVIMKMKTIRRCSTTLTRNEYM